ncbi:hypothetical protein HPB50_016920 [Hyalomma asiaticum]|uniref:Uncharacterized protein n=1 Tax=Hyalomma asiaticum TaxID=266040 RepID=A0ACB7TLN5_HYAAI|nr:hypothetical protein HPB50_016920 [Hyalomma asiaticum]
MKEDSLLRLINVFVSCHFTYTISMHNLLRAERDKHMLRKVVERWPLCLETPIPSTTKADASQEQWRSSNRSRNKIKASFVNAAEYSDGKTFPVVMVDSSGWTSNSSSIRSSDPEVAHQAATPSPC